MLGDWLQPATPVKAVCDFIEKVHLQQDLEGFTGDPAYLRCDYATKFYGKLRSAIGGVYAWRAAEAKDPAEKERMRAAADFAFRQSLALCPYCREGIYRYVELLRKSDRPDDALLIAQSAANLEPQSRSLAKLIRDLQRKTKSGEPLKR
jgi:hypothetical protein